MNTAVLVLLLNNKARLAFFSSKGEVDLSRYRDVASPITLRAPVYRYLARGGGAIPT